jgi:DNA-binding CsgD family transcriptional regulator
MTTAIHEGRQQGRDLSGPARVPESPALAPREMRVLRHFRDGDTWAVIAQAEGVTHHTVSNYRAAILEKVGAVNVPNAVWLMRHELEDA